MASLRRTASSYRLLLQPFKNQPLRGKDFSGRFTKAVENLDRIVGRRQGFQIAGQVKEWPGVERASMALVVVLQFLQPLRGCLAVRGGRAAGKAGLGFGRSDGISSIALVGYVLDLLGDLLGIGQGFLSAGEIAAFDLGLRHR